jgi:HSP20 family protein
MFTFADPFEALFSMQRALDAQVASDWMGRGTAGSGSYPAVNIFKKDSDFVAIFELPGIGRNDIEISAKADSIRVSGKKVIDYGEGASAHRRERVSGVFDRTLSLPVQIDPDRIQAEYNNGILALLIPVAESQKPKTIQIR